MNFWKWLWSLIINANVAPRTTTTTTLLSTTTTTTPIAATTTTTTTLGSGGKLKKALCFGINDYPGSQNDLQGCVNDATKLWGDLLKNQCGFDVTILTDKQNKISFVRSKMEEMVTNAKAGDVLFIQYSGHGTSKPDTDGDEIDGKDEALCLISDDGNSITLLMDDEIRAIFDKLPAGVKLTFVSDSCFSGSVTRAFLATMSDNSFYSKPRYIPPQDDMEATRLMMLPSLRAFAYPEEGMNHVLISGTDDKSYSYDANIDGQPCGAFSYYAVKILKANPKITYNDFYTQLKKYLPSGDYPQNPQLEGSAANKASIMFE